MDIKLLMDEYKAIDLELMGLKDTCDAYTAKASLLKKQIVQLKEKSEELQHRIGSYMANNGVVEENYGNVTVAPKKLPDVINILSASDLPSDYINECTTVTKTPDKQKIKADILNGKVISGAVLEQGRYAIRFKNVKLG
tara:strand:- start:99 stop:515 length:417 start_codon:yes stop_codon:yes gene_type:complete